ncbi:MAG: hypothetical protein DMD34_13825 [Gemmatimonadetes bacterium]|nr:MAG: hypothetical protein DMD46_09670 [Gemmatimonadota bacterium]PYP92651.1 MAG: hypothetical protein DMD34_13825 [Gemmatimonadota bacterium]
MFGLIPEWAAGVGFIMFVIFIGKALSGRVGGPPRELRGRHASRRDLGEALEDMQRRLAQLEEARSKPGELEDLQTRLTEMEERLDFAERLLAKPKERSGSSS